MWINRSLAPELVKLAEQYPAIVLTGPRQVGKTSLLERCFPGYRYVTLDYAQNAESAETSPLEFLQRNPPPLIIDEIQYAPTLLRHIKGEIDRRNGQKGLYLITGSQGFPLMQSVSESLAGRTAVLTLAGLSYGEWAARPDRSECEDPARFLFRGGFPGLWNDPDTPRDRDRWYQSYVTTYLERDVRNILNIGRLRDFERFLRVCADRTGQVLNMSDMGRDVGISPTTAREWISVLEASHQIYLLEPWYQSRGKRLTKSPKLYFLDTGLALFLAGYSTPEALNASPRAGAFWENHVVGQWLRRRFWSEPATALWFWQDQQKHEVDLLIEKEGRLTPIECKYKEKPGTADARGINYFRGQYPPEMITDGVIACTTNQPFEVAPDIMARSGWD
jgi:predicted AAA+ superfamily ATPase